MKRPTAREAALPRRHPRAIRASEPGGDCEIAVRLQPRARANEIIGERDGLLHVRVSAPPAEGRANDALCRLIAKKTRVGLRRVSVVRGERARQKVVRVQGADPEQLRALLTGRI